MVSFTFIQSDYDTELFSTQYTWFGFNHINYPHTKNTILIFSTNCNISTVFVFFDHKTKLSTFCANIKFGYFLSISLYFQDITCWSSLTDNLQHRKISVTCVSKLNTVVYCSGYLLLRCIDTHLLLMLQKLCL